MYVKTSKQRMNWGNKQQAELQNKTSTSHEKAPQPDAIL
jgi:hypothetical protein